MTASPRGPTSRPISQATAASPSTRRAFFAATRSWILETSFRDGPKGPDLRCAIAHRGISRFRVRRYASPRNDPSKKPGRSTGPYYFDQRNRLRGFIRNRGIVAIGIALRIGISVSVSLGFGLGAAARTLGELGFDFLDRLGFGHVLHHRDFPRQTIERRLIELAFAVGLFGLRFGAIEIEYHFGDGHDVSRIDLGFIFLGPARPHRALDAGAGV